MVFYPLSTKQQQASKNFDDGNFSLWYNKYIPLNDKFEASNNNGKENEKIEFYREKYDSIANQSEKFLRNKHREQIHFCKTYTKNNNYKEIVITAKLKMPLITGIGEPHPSETNMIFDHNIGVPYIPATSIKGVARFAHILSILLDGNLKLKEKYQKLEEIKLEDTDIPDIFGGDKNTEDKIETYKGSVVFLDAYPLNVPKLKVDIMNPHYGEYYNGEKPPADYLEPKPIKFLAVKEKETFIFRAVAKKEIAKQVQIALIRAITKEGVGAKTALGYGIFEVVGYKEPENLRNDYKIYEDENMTDEEKDAIEKEKFVEEIKTLTKESASMNSHFDKWQKDEKLKGDREIAKMFKDIVRKKKSNGEFSKQYEIVAEILGINIEKKSTQEIQTDKTKDEKVKEKMMKYIQKGVISKKDLKKISKYKNMFPELYKQLKKLKNN